MRKKEMTKRGFLFVCSVLITVLVVDFEERCLLHYRVG